jgi:hypothetical protein
MKGATMSKSELVHWLQKEFQQWETFINEIAPERMEEPGVAGYWSIKDIIAHLSGWNKRLIASLQAALRGELEPPPPWPAQLEEDDDVNAWIYENNHDRSLADIRNEARQVHEQLVATIEGMPDDVRIELRPPAFYLVWVGDQYYVASEFFNHFSDDHEQDIRDWLARGEKQ